jgi:L-malate glycosyltransferase
MGLPVIVSTNCGARNDQVCSGLNGFIVELNNPEGMAFFMDLLANEEKLPSGMADAATRFPEMANVDRFVKSDLRLARFDRPAQAEKRPEVS